MRDHSVSVRAWRRAVPRPRSASWAIQRADLVAVEGRIEPHTAVALLIEPVLHLRDVFGARQAQLLAEMQKANGGQIAGRQKIDGGRARDSCKAPDDFAVLHAAHLVGSQR